MTDTKEKKDKKEKKAKENTRGEAHGEEEEEEQQSTPVFIAKVSISIVFLIAGYLVESLTTIAWLSVLLFAVAYLVNGFSIIVEAIEGIMHRDVFNENFLMSVASLGAFIIGEYPEGCFVMLLYTIGEFLEDLAVGRSRRAIVNSLQSQSPEVTVLRNGQSLTVSPEDVTVGETFTVKPGERIELDGEILDGTSEVDTSALTGESIPASVSAGDPVYSGSVCCDGMLKIKATKPYSESTVARILSMIEDANEKKSSTEKFITRFAHIYTPIVCLIALLIILIPPIFFGGEWLDWLYRGLSALVVSCPCAIVVSVPLSFFAGLGACSRQGILIKGSNYLEMLAKCDTAVFDKTGTITSGKFEYVNCECINCHCSDHNEHRELLGLIAACEEYSTHPLAKTIRLAFGQFADQYTVTEAQNFPGEGVGATIDGTKYFAGNARLMQRIGVDYRETKLIGTAVYLCTEDEFLGDIVFADSIKQDSKEAIQDLKSLGFTNTYMLTGDKEPIARDICERAGLSHYRANLMPQDKVSIMKEIKSDDNTVLYAGDGINDAPVLAEADLGIAMGDIGSDLAVETADAVIMGDSLSKIAAGRRTARHTMNIATENIIFSIVIKVAIIIGCATGIFDENAMWLAVFGDVGVCLIAVANSLRAMLIPKKNNVNKK